MDFLGVVFLALVRLRGAVDFFGLFLAAADLALVDFDAVERAVFLGIVPFFFLCPISVSHFRWHQQIFEVANIL